MENNNNHIYSLIFKDKEGKTILKEYLSNETPIVLEIPENTLWIELKINKLLESGLYLRYTIYNLILDNILLECFNKDKDRYYITTSRYKYYPNFTENNLLTFETKEKLQDYLRLLITLFHDNQYGWLNSHYISNQNIKTSIFSSKLNNLLDSKTIREKKLTRIKHEENHE